MSGILQGVEHSALVCLQYSKHVSKYFFFWQFAPLLIAPLLIPVLLNPKQKANPTIVFGSSLHRSIPSWTCSGGLGLVHVRSSYKQQYIGEAIKRYIYLNKLLPSPRQRSDLASPPLFFVNMHRDTIINKPHKSSRATS